MSLTRFWMRPLDTLYFGPPSSSTAGETHTGTSLFPPPISAFQGMVRTKLLTSATETLDLSGSGQRRIESLIGTPERLPEGWQLEGPFPMVWRADSDEDPDALPVAQPWFPTPRFLFGTGAEAPKVARILDDWSAEQDSQRATNDLRGQLMQQEAGDWLLGLPHPAKAKVKPLDGWISVDNLHHALTGEGRWQPEGVASPLPPFVQFERRAGVAIEPETGTAQDQQLYFQEGLRFASSSGLAGWLEARLIPPLRAEGLQAGVGRAGKATRLISFEPLGERTYKLSQSWQALEAGRHLLPEHIASIQKRSEAHEPLFAWLVLMTPVHLPTEERLLPQLRMHHPSVRVRVRGALLGDAILEGGYFSVKKEVRPNRPLLPAGSCWLLELSGGDAASYSSVLRALNAHHPLGDEHEGRMGYGLTMVGLREPRWRMS